MSWRLVPQKIGFSMLRCDAPLLLSVSFSTNISGANAPLYFSLQILIFKISGRDAQN